MKWLENEFRDDAIGAILRSRHPEFSDTVAVPRTCCERHGINCDHGKSCPEAASAATEVGVGVDDYGMPKWVSPRLGFLLCCLSAACVVGLIAWASRTF